MKKTTERRALELRMKELGVPMRKIRHINDETLIDFLKRVEEEKPDKVKVYYLSPTEEVYLFHYYPREDTWQTLLRRYFTERYYALDSSYLPVLRQEKGNEDYKDSKKVICSAKKSGLYGIISISSRLLFTVQKILSIVIVKE